DIGRDGGQRLDPGDDHQEEHGDAHDHRNGRDAHVRDPEPEDDEERDPRNERAVGGARDGLHERLAVGAAVEEAAPGDEPRPDQHEAGERPEREIRPDGAEYGDAQGKRDELWHDPSPRDVGPVPVPGGGGSDWLTPYEATPKQSRLGQV